MKACALIAICLFYSTVAMAQKSKSDTASPEISLCSMDFAKSVVDQQVFESNALAETEKLINIRIRSADFIWTIDEPAARGYFTDAFRAATDRFNEKGFETKNDKGLVTRLPDYRFEVIRAIAKRDAEWSKRLLEQLLKEYEKAAADRKDSFDKDREIGETMRIAVESVEANPALSWFLFRRTMRYPLDVHWYFALYQIASKDRSFADQLYAELLRVYANESPRRFLFLSAYPFARERIFGIEKFSYGTSMPAQFQGNPELENRFLEIFLQRVSAYAADPANLKLSKEPAFGSETLNIVTALEEIEPIVAARFPQLIQACLDARARAGAMLNELSQKQLDEKREQNESLGYSFNERLAKLEEADSEGKLTDFMIVQLVTWNNANRTDDEYRRIEKWLAKIKDEDVRAGTTNYFWFLRAKLAVKESRFDDARRFSQKIPDTEFRALISFDIAEAQLKNPRDAASVYQTIGELSKMADGLETSITKARLQIAIAALYEKFNRVFAMNELGDAVKTINRLENPDILKGSVARQIRGKDFSFFAVLAMPGADLESTFKNLSKDDFDLPMSQAKALTDKYLKTLAVIAVAQNCVEKLKAKEAKKKQKRT